MVTFMIVGSVIYQMNVDFVNWDGMNGMSF